MYTVTNYKTKKALKEAVNAGGTSPNLLAWHVSGTGSWERVSGRATFPGTTSLVCQCCRQGWGRRQGKCEMTKYDLEKWVTCVQELLQDDDFDLPVEGDYIIVGPYKINMVLG